MLQTIQSLLIWIANSLDTNLFVVEGTAAIVLVSLICGSVGALVVGNRMAFFSDALAHCSFAGIALGIISAVLVGGARHDEKIDWLLPVVMILAGVVFGVGIVYVRERTSLASDTVIGVFFAVRWASAPSCSALKIIANKSPEQFLFGAVVNVTEFDLVMLGLLALHHLRGNDSALQPIGFRELQHQFGSFAADSAATLQLSVHHLARRHRQRLHPGGRHSADQRDVDRAGSRGDQFKPKSPADVLVDDRHQSRGGPRRHGVEPAREHSDSRPSDPDRHRGLDRVVVRRGVRRFDVPRAVADSPTSAGEVACRLKRAGRECRTRGEPPPVL